jgi:hypothetical protein
MYNKLDNKILNNEKINFKINDNFLTTSFIPLLITLTRLHFIHEKYISINSLESIYNLNITYTNNYSDNKYTYKKLSNKLNINLHDLNETEINIIFNTPDFISYEKSIIDVCIKKNVYLTKEIQSEFSPLYDNLKQIDRKFEIYVHYMDFIKTEKFDEYFEKNFFKYLKNIQTICSSDYINILHLYALENNKIFRNDITSCDEDESTIINYIKYGRRFKSLNSNCLYKSNFLLNMNEKKIDIKECMNNLNNNYHKILNLLSKVKESINFMINGNGIYVFRNTLHMNINNHLVYTINDFNICKYIFNPYYNLLLNYFHSLDILGLIRSKIEDYLLTNKG